MNKNIKYMYYSAFVAALLFVLPNGLAAQAGTMNDGINSDLTKSGNFIYYGKYKHAKEYVKNSDNTVRLIDGSFRVTAHEADSTPILWRIMGKEINYATLMSQYVIDTLVYDASGINWPNSHVKNILNDNNGFASSFTNIETTLIKDANVFAPTFSVTNGPSPPSSMTFAYMPLTSPAPTSMKFYLPWGTPFAQDPPGYNHVFWGVSGNSPWALSADSIADNKASIKGDAANPVYYWLRNMRDSVSSSAMLVKPDGNIDMAGTGVSMGVRPMFQLDTSKVIFAAELMDRTELNQLDQDIADGSPYYCDGNVVGMETGTSGDIKVFKLTVCDGSAAPTGLKYDYDETLYGSGTVAMKPDDTLRLNLGAQAAGYDSTAYKLVSDGIGGNREIRRRGFTPVMTGNNDYIDIVARNIYTDFEWNSSNNSYSTPNPDAGRLTSNCDAYVWLQKNNRYNSHVGSEPMHFNLHVIDDNIAPVLKLVGKVVRHPGGQGVTVNFDINEQNGGKYYYMIAASPYPNPANLTIQDFVDAVATPVYYNPPSGTSHADRIDFNNTNPQTATINLPNVFPDNNSEYRMYLLAKDSVRNESQILTLNIPQAVPNTKPDSIPLTITLRPGETKTIPVSAIAYDPDVAHYGDILKITSIDSLPPANMVSVLIVPPDSALLTISANATFIGDTAIYVTVKDYELDSTKCRIGIIVRELPPTAEIDFIEETLVNLQTPGRYLFTNADTVIDLILSSGNDVPIDDKWFGSTLDIVKLDPTSGIPLTLMQQLRIPTRPAAPVIYVYNESFDGFVDGRITLVNDSMEYSADSTLVEWIAIRTGRTEIVNLQPGVYYVRYKAIQGEQFVSIPVMAIVERGGVFQQLNREIILPAVDGVTTAPLAGSHRVMSSTSFTFTATFSGAQLVVKTNRDADGEQEVLAGVPNDNGGFDYIIRRITTTPIIVYIGPETVANEVLDDSSNNNAIWAYRGVVYIKSKHSGVANVYTLSGTLAAQVKTIEGETASVALPIGLYIVATSDGAHAKVVVE